MEEGKVEFRFQYKDIKITKEVPAKLDKVIQGFRDFLKESGFNISEDDNLIWPEELDEEEISE